jgi:hypothetical protein
MSKAAMTLATALAESGHEPTVITCHAGPMMTEIVENVRVQRVRRLPEAALRFRGFVTPLTQLPFTLTALRGSSFDVAHAFSEIDCWAALRWRRGGGGRVVFTPSQPPTRESLADRRQRLRLISHAFGQSDAVTAPDSAVRDAIERWVGLEVPVVGGADAPGYETIYRAQT